MLLIRMVDVAKDDSCVVPKGGVRISLFTLLLGTRVRHVDEWERTRKFKHEQHRGRSGGICRSDSLYEPRTARFGGSRICTMYSWKQKGGKRKYYRFVHCMEMRNAPNLFLRALYDLQLGGRIRQLTVMNTRLYRELSARLILLDRR